MTSARRMRLSIQVGATFVSPADEHYYGLGQNQHGFLDHRGHTVDCWNDYNATGGAELLRAISRLQIRAMD